MKTIKTKTSTLNSLALDWAVATLQGFTVKLNPMGFSSGSQSGFWIWEDKANGKMLLIGDNYSPSTNWNDGGDILDIEGISVNFEAGIWTARTVNDIEADGKTLLVAAMRSYVTDKLGEYIELPELLSVA
jgi:hypothetical protein